VINHLNLIILTPGHSMMADYVKSLLGATKELDRRGITWGFSSEYASHVANAREITLSATRENDLSDSRPFAGALTYDKLLWIDSDIAFTPDDVIKAYESTYDIVSGAYLFADGSVAAHLEFLGTAFSYEQILDMTEPVKIAGAGMGFMAVKSRVFESLSRPWFQSPTIAANINGKTVNVQITGEDLSFCYRASEAGFEIWLDPTIKVQHHKTMKLTWEGITP